MRSFQQAGTNPNPLLHYVCTHIQFARTRMIVPLPIITRRERI